MGSVVPSATWVGTWHRAGLLIVGSRGVGGFHGLVMRSTSRTLIEHVSCPLVVVPHGVHPDGHLPGRAG
jgi:nucleotide-binding universal stress UspA family protein